MSKIKKLDKGMINQIAAGEVVIQPCSVLKELVENSIDAGASKVEVNFFGSGADQIEVHDNGMGMQKEDLELCIEPHATSKITNIDDLYQVMSCGFRGEALASIAEVSEFEITSKAHDADTAYALSNNTGKLTCLPASRGFGTSILVKNLFHNVPVRRRFLKSERAETSQNLDILKKLALSRPWVGIEVNHDQKHCFRCPQDQDLKDRIRDLDIFDKKVELLDLAYTNENIEIEGICVQPPQHYGNANKIQLFVNRRPFKDKALNQALVKAYSSYIPERRFPGAVIFINMPAEDVDVNIHPTKSEVRFHNSEQVFKAIYAAARNILVDSAQIHDASESSTPLVYKKTGNIRTVPMNRSYGGVHDNASTTPFKDHAAEPPSLFKEWNKPKSSFPENTQVRSTPFLEEIESIPEDNRTEPSFQVNQPPRAFQLLNRFIVIEQDDCFEIMDQHAVHERVLFNQLFHDEKEKVFDSQFLLAPIEITFPENLIDVSDSIKSDFERMGYKLQWLEEQNILQVLSIPDFMTPEKSTSILEEILEELAEGVLPNRDELRKNILHSTACRAAIKAGDSLTEEELKTIVAATLSMDDTQGCCPHGRNSTWRITIAEANAMFNR